LSVSQRAFKFIFPSFLFLKARFENKIAFQAIALFIFPTGKVRPFQKAEAVLLFFRGSQIPAI